MKGQLANGFVTLRRLQRETLRWLVLLALLPVDGFSAPAYLIRPKRMMHGPVRSMPMVRELPYLSYDPYNRLAEGGFLLPPAYCVGCSSYDRIRIVASRDKFRSDQWNSLSCGQRELLRLAKKVAPRRRRSIGLCGPGVQRIITATENANPGLHDFPIPSTAGSGRYPPNFAGWLQDRGWQDISAQVNVDAINANQENDNIPPGTVVIFRGPKDFTQYNPRRHAWHAGEWVGHITIKGDDGLWYTDGREPRAHIPNRFFEAAFIPGPEQNAAASYNCGVDPNPPVIKKKKKKKRYKRRWRQYQRTH